MRIQLNTTGSFKLMLLDGEVPNGTVYSRDVNINTLAKRLGLLTELSKPIHDTQRRRIWNSVYNIDSYYNNYLPWNSRRFVIDRVLEIWKARISAEHARIFEEHEKLIAGRDVDLGYIKPVIPSSVVWTFYKIIYLSLTILILTGVILKPTFI